MAKRKWVLGLWVISAVVVTAGWWAGLGFGAIWLAQRAFF
jgi:hypothetical protein